MTSGTTAYLYDLWGSSGDDVYAVGTNGTIIHYNGSTWSEMTNPTNGGIALFAVWGTSQTNVFSAGGGSTILHYGDGSNNSRNDCIAPIINLLLF